MLIKLAYRNLVGAGLRTWLKVAVLSLSYVLRPALHMALRIGRRPMLSDIVTGCTRRISGRMPG